MRLLAASFCVVLVILLGPKSVSTGEPLIDRKSLGPNDCASFSFDIGQKGFSYEIYISGFESDQCKPSQFRVSKLFMKDSCYERDSDGDPSDSEIFPTWCWSGNSKSVEEGEQGCLDAFYGAPPSSFVSLPQAFGGRDHWIDGGNMCYIKSGTGFVYVKSTCPGRATITIKARTSKYQGQKWCFKGAGNLGPGWIAFLTLAVALVCFILTLLFCWCLPCCPLICYCKSCWRWNIEQNRTLSFKAPFAYPRQMDDSMTSRVPSPSFVRHPSSLHPMAHYPDYEANRPHSFSAPTHQHYNLHPHVVPPPFPGRPGVQFAGAEEINMSEFSPLHRHKQRLRTFH